MLRITCLKLRCSALPRQTQIFAEFLAPFTFLRFLLKVRRIWPNGNEVTKLAQISVPSRAKLFEIEIRKHNKLAMIFVRFFSIEE